MSLAEHLRKMAQHDDWRPYNCRVTNAVLSAFLAVGDREHLQDDTQLRTYMLVVACALDDLTDGVTVVRPASGDTGLLDFLREESLDLRCFNQPTGGDDYEVRWRVVQHHMAEPHEREVGESFTDEPRDAIRDAMQRLGHVLGVLASDANTFPQHTPMTKR